MFSTGIAAKLASASASTGLPSRKLILVSKLSNFGVLYVILSIGPIDGNSESLACKVP